MREYRRQERRQVSFNTADAVELDLLKFVDRDDINFSGLVKCLLFAYKMGQMQPVDYQNERLEGPPRTKPSANTSEIQKSGMPFDF